MLLSSCLVALHAAAAVATAWQCPHVGATAVVCSQRTLSRRCVATVRQWTCRPSPDTSTGRTSSARTSTSRHSVSWGPDLSGRNRQRGLTVPKVAFDVIATQSAQPFSLPPMHASVSHSMSHFGASLDLCLRTVMTPAAPADHGSTAPQERADYLTLHTHDVLISVCSLCE